MFRCMQPGGFLDSYPAGVEYVDVSAGTVGGSAYVFGEQRDDEALARKAAASSLADRCLAAGEYAKAEELGLVAVERAPKAEDSWLLLGRAYLGQGKIDDAIDALRQGLAGQAGSLKPVVDAQCRNLLGVCYQKKGDLEAARREFIQVIESGIDYEGSLAFAEEHLDEITLALE
jgi:tetratricopeptide (TPR) repeat protein